MHRADRSVFRRVILGVCILGILAVCLVAGRYIQVTMQQLQDTHRTIYDQQLRNGFVAMNDAQRLVAILQEAAWQGEVSPEAAADFQAAADFLFVRIDNLGRALEDGASADKMMISIGQLEQVQALADHLLATDFADLSNTSIALTQRSQAARRALISYLDDMQELQYRISVRQSDAIARQQRVVWGTLICLLALAVVAVFLLYREVRARGASHLAQQRIRHLAFFDTLTGLPNRTSFQDYLDTLLNGRNIVSLLLVDLDGFKLINDTYGHAAGDAILRHVSAKMKRHTQRDRAFVARLGGDEFAIIVQTHDCEEISDICSRLIAEISEPILYEGEVLSTGASIGVALSRQMHPEFGTNVDSLSRFADFALYASKSQGKNRFTFYDKVLEQKYLERRAMIDQLPRAIADGSIDYFLQPKVDLHTGRTHGFEALVRWYRNGRFISPLDFIAIAEESALITDIDYCVLRAATRDLAAHNLQHGTRFAVSVNFSTLHFTSQRFVDTVADALAMSGLPPGLLTIEMTESAEMQDWRAAKQIIAALHHLGVKISIDDFGAGFSSLAYLRTTIADEIKIDRSLVEDVETSDRSRFLLDSILDIAENLELAVIVEGIETRQQADIVRAMGAQTAQGNYFGAAAPKHEALARAQAEKPAPAIKAL
ncbi:putative bifunctional diguanylate cyclase/phosphodiesterase [Loktanella agnita]|uniref:putative bifunctional diguanylate cyclase/phosphodiesterase n=1 Tax=Loktanella agnita TaxID=287097 RepID=UPI00398634F2